MIKWLERKTLLPMLVVNPGDTLRLHYFSDDGRHEIIEQPVTESGAYDTMAIGEIKDELGFKEGLVAVIGRTAA